MLADYIIFLIRRDLEHIISELEAYHDESKMWEIDKNISNSAGNLALHLVGNLNSFIGANLGKTGYIRDRPLEFSSKNVARTEIIEKIKATIDVVENSLSKLTTEQLSKPYPFDASFPHRIMKDPSTAYFLLHLTSHLAYHLGQINYHRRLLDVS